jgi:hypothetical protein
MAVDPTTGGYWLVASDGGIFAYNAPFYGSTASIVLNHSIVGMAPDVGTGGYWLVASDGGIFTFHAPFEGSMGSVALNKPIVGMAPDTASGGYRLVASDGGIFSFNAPFYGSAGAILLNRPIVGMEANGTGTGYRFVASDGGIFDFGSSAFAGSAVTGVTTLPDTAPTTTTSTTAPSPTTTGPSTTTTTAPPPTTTTTTAPTATGTITVSFAPSSAMGCAQPATPGCYVYIAVNGSGWSPNTTYDLTITGPGISGATGNTATTNSDGVVSAASGNGDGFGATTTSAGTTDPPTPGTYTVTMGGVTGSYTYAPPEAVTVWLLNYPNCAAGSVTCTWNIEFIATGFPPDDTLPVAVTWDGTQINSTHMTTDATGGIWLVTVGTTPALPVADPPGIATVTVGTVTGSAAA